MSDLGMTSEPRVSAASLEHCVWEGGRAVVTAGRWIWVCSGNRLFWEPAGSGVGVLAQNQLITRPLFPPFPSSLCHQQPGRVRDG